MVGRTPGTPKTGGRKKGSKNKRTRELEAKMQETAAKVAEVLPRAFEGDAHAFLMMIYKDKDQPLATRLDAAKAAIGFETPKLTSVEHMPAEIDLSKLTDEQLVELDHLLAKAMVEDTGTSSPSMGR